MRKLLMLLAATGAFAQTPYQTLAREVLKELIEINTTDTAGDNTRAAAAMAARFRKAGYPEADVKVLGPQPRKGNLVATLRGTGPATPVLFIGHLDVVEALLSDWSVDPFRFTEEGGFFYGRRTQDTKSNDAMLVAAFLRMKQEKFRPTRNLILALTADEESGPANGIDWLVTQRPRRRRVLHQYRPRRGVIKERQARVDWDRRSGEDLPEFQTRGDRFGRA
jgi:acetylornithine deacetylase/succinyl-diaminopimelate desuccinylase-like protein